ncbi:hypothetical protein FGO68_gene36 [Halteria grandinella]|uniref:Transmembrane protein n=1 Tax=Halteria grandinella TaxID=5974 RepID=A0A8J8T6J5_HALGN|nr:hypothetical protein FGO68_gene36 [Halteria grandinella]
MYRFDSNLNLSLSMVLILNVQTYFQFFDALSLYFACKLAHLLLFLMILLLVSQQSWLKMVQKSLHQDYLVKFQCQPFLQNPIHLFFNIFLHRTIYQKDLATQRIA